MVLFLLRILGRGKPREVELVTPSANQELAVVTKATGMYLVVMEVELAQLIIKWVVLVVLEPKVRASPLIMLMVGKSTAMSL